MSVNDLRRKMVTSGLAGLAVAFLPGAHNSRSYAQGKQPQDLSRGDAMLEVGVCADVDCGQTCTTCGQTCTTCSQARTQ
jgi:hypothetical protein